MIHVLPIWILKLIPLSPRMCNVFHKAIMCFHSILDLTFFYIGLNSLTIPSSHHHGGLPSGHFWSLGYHSTTAWVHLLSVLLILFPFPSLPNHLTLDVLMQRYSQHASFYSPPCYNQLPFFLLYRRRKNGGWLYGIVHILLVYNIVGKIVLWFLSVISYSTLVSPPDSI